MMEKNVFDIVVILIIFVFVIFGFSFNYNLGFNKGVKSVCGNLTAYSMDDGKTYSCGEKNADFVPNFRFNYTLKGWGG